MIDATLPTELRLELMIALRAWRDGHRSLLQAPSANNNNNTLARHSRVPTLIGEIPLDRLQQRWPRTRRDVERDVRFMEAQLDTDFRCHIRDERQAAAAGAELARLAGEFDLLTLAAGLRWLCGGWCVGSVALLLRHLTDDWPAELAGAVAGLLLEGLPVARVVAVQLQLLTELPVTQLAGYMHTFLHAWDGERATAGTAMRSALRRSLMSSVLRGLSLGSEEIAAFHRATGVYRHAVVARCSAVAGHTASRPLPALQRAQPCTVDELLASSVPFAYLNEPFLPTSVRRAPVCTTLDTMRRLDSVRSNPRTGTAVSLTAEVAAVSGTTEDLPSNSARRRWTMQYRRADRRLQPRQPSSALIESPEDWRSEPRHEVHTTDQLAAVTLTVDLY